MRPADAKTAAGLLTEAWQMGMTLAGLPDACRPKTAAEAYRVQSLFAGEVGLPVGGWKIGCTSAAARKILGARGPFAGRIIAPRILESGVTLPAAAYRMCGIEGEIAFRLKKDLPPRKRPYSRRDVTAAIGAVVPAIEVIGPRYTDWSKVGLPSIIADFGANGCLVVGKPLARWEKIDLTKLRLEVQANGKRVGEGTGEAALGDPVEALRWLANFLRTRGGLSSGQIVSTGTCTGLHRSAAGESIVAKYGRLGEVHLRFV